MNILSEIIDFILNFLDIVDSPCRTTNRTIEEKRDLDYVEVYRKELEHQKDIDKRLESQRRERYESGRNNGTMDEI